MKLFKKKKKETVHPKHNVDGTVLTLGLDLDSKYSVTLQEVDSIPCICLHKHYYDSGQHWSEMNGKTLEAAVPVERILKYCAERPHRLTHESLQYIHVHPGTYDN